MNNPDKKLRLFQYLLGSVHSYSSHHFIWTSSWIDWKKIFVILSAKIDNDMSIFFVNNPDQKLRLFQYLLGSVHSYSSHHFIWTSSWIDWKKIFVIMSAKIDNDMSIFFVNNPDKKLRLFEYLLASVQSYTSPHFIWTSPWLDWWNTFCETAYRHFLERKVWQRHEWSFREELRLKKFFCFSTY